MTLKTSRRMILSTLILPWLCLPMISRGAQAQVTWQMATEYPQTNISGVGLETFGKLVEERTHGFVKTVTAYDNALKISSGEMIKAAEGNRITGGDAFAGPLEKTDAVFGFASLPFVVQSNSAAKSVNAKARPFYQKALAAHGLKLLYMTIWPATGIWTERPLETPEDLKALAVRTYDYNSADVMKAVGATAEYLPLNDAIAKLKDHSLNAILSSGDGGAGRKLWTQLRYFTAINYAIPISIAFVRQSDFDALPKKVQTEVAAAAAETGRKQFEILSSRIVENYKTMRSNGVTIVDPAPQPVMAALKGAAKTPIAAWKAKVPAAAARLVRVASER